MGVFPPWISSSVVTPYVAANSTSQLVTSSAGYSWLWEPPAVTGARPDLIRLSIQWAAVVALFGLWVIAGLRQPVQNTTAKTSKPDGASG
jgi:hypothetical protein